MAALSYMQRRKSGTYEFRRRLPEALAGKAVPEHMRDVFPELINVKTSLFKREVVRTLDTKDLKEAKRRDHREALRATTLFDQALNALVKAPDQPIHQVDPAAIAEAVYAELLASDEVERLEGDDRRHHQTAQERAQWPDLIAVPSSDSIGMSEDHFEAYGAWMPELEQDYREAYARRDPRIVYPETNIELKKRGVFYEKGSAKFQAVALAILEAHVRAYGVIDRRQRGEIVHTPVAVTPIERGPKLSEAFEVWKQGGTAHGARKPGNNTITEAEQAVRYFTELHGDMRIGDITREKSRQYRDAIAKIPRSLPGNLRRLPLPQLLLRDLTQFEPRKATTVHKLLQMVGAVITRAEREGYLDKLPGFANPFDKSIRYSIQKSETVRKLFAKADLKAIFASPVFAEQRRPRGGGGEAAFWFPLIGLFSGMRLDEIAQLRICDLQQDEETDRWLFDVDRSGGRSTKTDSSIRQVPVHLELIRIGLIGYREGLLELGASPEDSLWPDVLAKGARQRSAAWSKWFGRYLRETCGVTDTTKVFHSFRHTFKRMARDAGLPEEQHDALTGHSGGSGTGSKYGPGVSLKPLIRAIDKVEAPVDLHQIHYKSRV